MPEELQNTITVISTAIGGLIWLIMSTLEIIERWKIRRKSQRGKGSKIMEEYENAIKGLMSVVRTASQAAIAAHSLEDKIRFHRLRKALEGALSTVRLNLYEYEDATQVEVIYK